MDTEAVTRALDEALPDTTVLADLAGLLWEDNKDAAEIELDGHLVRVPRGTPLEVVTKAYFKEYFDVGFGAYRAQVAVGGVTREQFGILSAGICFATLYYNADRRPFTVDLHWEMR